MEQRDYKTECWNCQHKREVPGNTLIRCAKPDPDMKGFTYAIQRGWFYYPMLFDPVWKEVLCANYEAKEQ